MCTPRSGSPLSPSATKPHAFVVRHFDEVAETDSADLAFRPQRLLDETGALAASKVPSAADHRGHHPGLREPFADRPARTRREAAPSGSGDDGPGKRHSSISPFDPTRSTSTGQAAGFGRDPGDAAGAVAPGHRPGHVEARASLLVAAQRKRDEPRRSVRDKPALTTSGDPSLVVSATGSRLRPSADPRSE